MNSLPHPRFRSFATGALALMLSATVSLSHAGTFTWATPGVSGNWDTTTSNWTGTGATWANGNQAEFTGTAGYTVTVTEPITATQLAGISGPNAITISNSGATTITGGTITLTGASATISHTATANINSVIAGSVGLRVNGSGNLSLGAINTYTGDTTITGGTLRIGVLNAIPTASNIAFGGTGRTLDVNGFNTTVGSLSGSNGVLNNSSTTTAVTVTIGGSTSTSTGAIVTNGTRALSLVKQGSGTQTFNNGSAALLNYTGSTTISAGTLRLTNQNFVSTSSVLINGGTLSTSAAGNTNLGLGSFTMSSGAITPGEAGAAGTFTLAADKTFTTTGGQLNFDIGTSFDQIIGSGGASAFSLTNTTLFLTGDTSVVGTYNLFTGFSSGTVSGLTISGLGAGFTGSLSNLGVLTVSASAVPEPSTYAVIGGLAALALGIASRRRRSSNAS